MSKVFLGLGGSDHDFSAALMVGQDIRVAIEEERLSRRKHGLSFWYENPVQKAIEYCLKAESLSLKDVDAIVSSDILPIRVRHELRGTTIRLYPHHLCHAASAYLMLPIGMKAGVIVYDGFGSICDRVPDVDYQNVRETFSFFLFGPDGYKCIGRTVGRGFIEDDFPTTVTNSIGLLYELITALLGNHPMDCGKTMGLSSHGVPRHLEVLDRFVSHENNPNCCFSCSIDDPALINAIEDVLGGTQHTFRVKADIAASIQTLVNRTLLHCEQFFVESNIDVLCIVGGCALNTVANSFLVEHSQLGIPIVIPPFCGDAGVGLGAFWIDQFKSDGELPHITFRGAPTSPHLSRPGQLYSREQCIAAVQEFYPKLALDPSVVTGRDVARFIASGGTVGVLNGRSELGPRALGGRSILADPRQAMTRERINRVLKHREPYRPLAPMVLRSRYGDYFLDDRNADEFMLKVARCNERCLRDAPAIVHVDGTARVQVVSDEGDPFLIDLLQAFRERTGVGLLINTSFNRRSEPIVESPLDAIDSFLGMQLDGLYLEGQFYRPAVAAKPNS